MLICVLWGQQRLPCQEVACSQCGARLAICNDSVEMCRRKDLLPVCYSCVKPGAHELAGIAIGGQLYSDPGEALRAFDLHQRRN